MILKNIKKFNDSQIIILIILGTVLFTCLIYLPI